MYKIYQIEDEKNLMEIANKFNTTEENLKKINGINENIIVKRGNFLIVPLNETIQNDNFEYYVVNPGDTIYEIAEKYNINYKDLLNLNGLDKDQYIYPNQQIMVPKANTKFIITNNNQTLSDVSKKLSTTENEIIGQNATIYLSDDQLIVYKKRD